VRVGTGISFFFSFFIEHQFLKNRGFGVEQNHRAHVCPSPVITLVSIVVMGTAYLSSTFDKSWIHYVQLVFFAPAALLVLYLFYDEFVRFRFRVPNPGGIPKQALDNAGQID
jgi:hypothetical protein